MHQYIITLVFILFSSYAAAQPVVNGNIISWPDDGWYQVQRMSDYTSVCEGGRSCEVEPSLHVVINHTTGKRYENIEVKEGSGTETLQLSDASIIINIANANYFVTTQPEFRILGWTCVSDLLYPEYATANQSI